MSFRFRSDLAVAILAAVLSLSSVGSVMRETDQASLLDGSIQLARGAAPRSLEGLYLYDKQFVSYWLLSGLWVAGTWAGFDQDADGVVFAANLFASLMFWFGVFFLVSRRPSNRAVSTVMLLAALAAPALLLNSPLLCSNIISGGFLAFLAGLLAAAERENNSELVLLAAVTFGAVGSRADAVLCLPFLLWVSVRTPSLGRLCASRRHVAIMCGAVAALVAGVCLVDGPKVYLHPPMTILKVFAAFLVFGLGGGLVVVVILCGLIAGKARRARSLERKLFLAAGLLGVLIPLAFYGFQLYTPRHLVTTALLVLFAATTWRGRALVRALPAGRARMAVGGIVLLAATVPLFIGVQLPEVRRPRLAWTEATRYPTADGLWPMGAYVDFMRDLRRAETEPIDHNQAIWSSLAAIELTDIDGVVPVFGTSLRPYFELAATLQHKVCRSVGRGEYGDVPFLIGDERMLRRSAKPAWGAEADLRDAMAALIAFPKEVISPAGAAQPVLRIEPGAPGESTDPVVEMRIALAGAFSGNEFDLLGAAADEFVFGPAGLGKRTVFYSDEPFEMIFGGEGESARREKDSLRAVALEYDLPSGEKELLYFAAVEAGRIAAGLSAKISEAAAAVHVARAVLPEYMSVGRLN